MANLSIDRLRRQLGDQRGGRVVFLSHCLLNENVRYLGGATRPGDVDEVVDAAQRAGVGICQLACPEQVAWGGVLKRHLLLAYGSDQRGTGPARRLLTRVFLVYTRWRYRRIARRVAAEIADYQRSGIAVVGVVGIDGSPSCGVQRTLDLERSVTALARCDLASMDAQAFNRRVVLANLVPGEGLFIAALRRQFQRRRLDVALYAHDLAAELDGGRDLPPGLQAALDR
jgi:predicted secreted protein